MATVDTGVRLRCRTTEVLIASEKLIEWIGAQLGTNLAGYEFEDDAPIEDHGDGTVSVRLVFKGEAW